MSWVSDYKYSWFEKLALNVIKASWIPFHVAFVMDGNRRYAKSAHLPQIDGHSHGFIKLADCLRWCLDLGIREVTVFAFSIENFKRSEEEVNGLLDLAREKFKKVLEDKQKLFEHGVRIKVVGNISLLPQDLQQLMAQAMLETQDNNQLYLNIAFSYTSRDELTQAVETVLSYGNQLQEQDIDEFLLDEALYVHAESGPDLLLRTSGETRISDFLMWQLSKTVLYFTKNMWPQLTIWDLFKAIFTYQRSRSKRTQEYEDKMFDQRCELRDKSNYFSKRVLSFVKCLFDYKKNVLHAMSTLSE